MKSSQNILIIGSAHLDIVATFREGSKWVDKAGEINFSIGGTAFNIASNLLHNNVDFQFYTTINRQTLGGDLLYQKLNNSFDKKIVFEEIRDSSESAYVSISNNDDLLSAVSYASIEKLINTTEILEKLIEKSELIVLDTNICEELLRKLVLLVKGSYKKLYVCNVSDSKLGRVASIGREKLGTVPFEMVTLNETEMLNAFGDISHSKLCDLLGTNLLIVTKGSNGYVVYNRFTGMTFTGKAPDIPPESFVSSLGAGDALFAALIEWVSIGSSLEDPALNQKVINYLMPVLQTKGATPGAAI